MLWPDAPDARPTPDLGVEQESTQGTILPEGTPEVLPSIEAGEVEALAADGVDPSIATLRSAFDGRRIECPLHQGRFDVRSGKALSAPVCVDLRTWPLKIENGEIFLDLTASE